MAALPHKPPLTVEEYFALDEATRDGKYEYYDGIVRFMAGGTPQHAIISANIVTTVNIAMRGSGCRALTSDARVQLSQGSYVYPDVTVSCSPEDLRDPKAIRSPIVVFEVLSPSTEKFDRLQKTQMYRACPSIQAFVLVDPTQLSVEVFQRDRVFWHHFQYNAPDALVDIGPLNIQIPISEFYVEIELPPASPPPPQEPEPDA